jgi:hypothetical protein
MKKLALFVLFLSFIAVTGKDVRHNDTAPDFMKGKFKDDYGIKYEISDTLWTQLPRTKFRIVKWNVKEQYLIARNGDGNPGEGGLYTRIDFMQFSNMDPWKWGYCLTAYDAKTDAIAESMAKADRKHPKTGCNGFPFSRMKSNE